MSKQFSANTRKDAYLKAVKWVATNVISKDELKDVIVKYEKDIQYPTITVHLFVSVDEEYVGERHCKICNETHKAFFISEETNCSWCKVSAYRKRLEEIVNVKAGFCSEKIM